MDFLRNYPNDLRDIRQVQSYLSSIQRELEDKHIFIKSEIVGNELIITDKDFIYKISPREYDNEYCKGCIASWSYEAKNRCSGGGAPCTSEELEHYINKRLTKKAIEEVRLF